MERVLEGILESQCIVYLEDLLIHTAYCDNSAANLCQVFHAIQWANLMINPMKCGLLQRAEKILGKVVSKRGIMIDPDMVQALEAWHQP